MSSYSNRIAAYNARMKVYGAESDNTQTTEQQGCDCDNNNYVTFAFYNNIEDAAKDKYPGGLAFSHDPSIGSGAIFKEGQIVTSKVLEISLTDERLDQAISSSATAKAGTVNVKYVDNAGLIKELTFQTVNQDYVKEMIAAMSASNTTVNSVDSFLKKTDNVTAICEHVSRVIDVQTTKTPEGYVQYKVNFKYEELYNEIIRDLKADDYIGNKSNDEKQDVLIEKNTIKIDAVEESLKKNEETMIAELAKVNDQIKELHATDESIKEALSPIKASYIADAKVMVNVPEEGEEPSLKDTVVLAKMNESESSTIEFDIPNEDFYNKVSELETAFSLSVEEMNAITKRIDSLESTDGSVWRELTGLHTAIDELAEKTSQEQEVLKEAIDSSLAELSESFNNKLESNAEIQNESLKTLESDLKNEIASVSDSVEALSEKMDAEDASLLGAMNGINNELSGQIEALDMKVDLNKQAADDMCLDISTSLNKRIDEQAEQTSEDYDRLIETVDEKFNKVNEELGSMNVAIEELGVDCSAFIEEAKKSLDEVQKVSDELTEIVESINDKFDSSINEIHGRLDEIGDNIETLNTNYSERFLKIDTSINALRNDFESFRTEINNKLNNAIIDIETLMQEIN